MSGARYDSDGNMIRSHCGSAIGPGPWCGTAGGYSNHECRCDDCTEAWRVHHLEYMRRSPEQRVKHRQRMRDTRHARRTQT